MYVPKSRGGIFRNESTWSTPLDPKQMFWCVLYYLGAFGTVGCLMELGAKRAEQVQKFVPRSRVGIFHNERTLSTPLDPKQMFWYVSYYLGTFGTVWFTYGIRCKTGRTSSKLRATKSHRNFFATNAPNPPHWTLNSCFGASHSMWVHLAMFHYYTKLGTKWVELVQLM